MLVRIQPYSQIYLFYGTLAQLVEHLIEAQGVPCSTHGGTT